MKENKFIFINCIRNEQIKVKDNYLKKINSLNRTTEMG